MINCNGNNCNGTKRPRIGIGIMVVKDNKILMGKRKSSHGAGSWAPPGGHLEFGETPEACAARELLEETGIRAISLRPGPWVNTIMEHDKHYVTIYVIVDQFVGEPQLMEPDKCEGWDWFAMNQLPSPIFMPMQSLIAKGWQN